jgi:hypothetical protein
MRSIMITTLAALSSLAIPSLAHAQTSLENYLNASDTATTTAQSTFSRNHAQPVANVLPPPPGCVRVIDRSAPRRFWACKINQSWQFLDERQQPLDSIAADPRQQVASSAPQRLEHEPDQEMIVQPTKDGGMYAASYQRQPSTAEALLYGVGIPVLRALGTAGAERLAHGKNGGYDRYYSSGGYYYGGGNMSRSGDPIVRH